MEQIEVEITGMVITQRYGTLNTGDILRTDAAYAKHLVEEAHGARYTSRETGAPESPPARATRAARTPTNKKAPDLQNKAAADAGPDAPAAPADPAANADQAQSGEADLTAQDGLSDQAAATRPDSASAADTAATRPTDADLA